MLTRIVWLVTAFALSSQAQTASQAHYGKASNGALLPDPQVTPGAVLTADAKVICRRGYAKSVRHVSEETKNQAYMEYGAKKVKGNCCETDHLISLEIGGSNDITNLWPQPYLPKPGAREKDKVENYLHAQVCTGKMSLTFAQQIIRTDWTQVQVPAHSR
jgi:hypothetical protein